ncbi:hypothetical protein V5O48_018031 [Marasmius crinis-equi]|uniref:Uncharacterized protein n=1 Tax=Marasmius crinis-equi TaxID=585013 RepID=A0ABR3EMA3_9AGAR
MFDDNSASTKPQQAGSSGGAKKKGTGSSKAAKGKGKAKEGAVDDKGSSDDDVEMDFDKLDGGFDEEPHGDDDVEGEVNGEGGSGEEDEEEDEDEEDEEEAGPAKKRFQLEYSPAEMARFENIENLKKRLAAVGVKEAVDDLFQRNANTDKDDNTTEQPKEPTVATKVPRPSRPQPRRVTRSVTASSAQKPAAEPELTAALPGNPAPTITALNSSPTRASSSPAALPKAVPSIVVSSPRRQASLPPITTLSVPPSSIPPTQAPTRAPTPSPPTAPPDDELFIGAYSMVEVGFDPAVDKVDPRGYAECVLARNMGEFLLTIPNNAVGTYESRSALYEAVVYKWMEVEAVLAELGVKEIKTSNSSRPDGFKAWFKNGRVGNRLKTAGSLDIPATACLEELRSSWWKWFDNNMPDWRPRINDKVVPGGEGNWEDCEMPGKDGMVLFLVGLRWWYDLVGCEDKEGGWEQAAKAVYYTLNRTLSERRNRPTPSLPAIRTSPDSSSATSERGKRQRTE